MSNWIYKKYSRIGEKDWYNLQKLLSYRPTINKFIIIGARQIGKTFTVKEKVFADWFLYKRQFVWARDNLEALKELKEDNGKKFFEDILTEQNKTTKFFKNAKIQIKGNSIKINNETAGIFYNLSTFQNKKGSAFTNVYNLVLDEFIDEKCKRQTKGKVEQVINSVKSIFSHREYGESFFLANAIDKSDELLQFWDLQITNFGLYINKNRKMLCHYADDSSLFKAKREKSFAYGFYRDTYLEAYIDGNAFLDNSDKEQFFDKMPTKSKHVCTLIINDYARIRMYIGDHKIYAINDNNPHADALYFTTDSQRIGGNTFLFENTQKDIFIEHLKNKNIFFENEFVKKNMLKFLGLLK